jgi:hypothetical protein
MELKDSIVTSKISIIFTIKMKYVITQLVTRKFGEIYHR